MQKPFFKKYLSYFRDTVLYLTKSEYNPVLIVLLSKGRYQLCTDSAVYSFEDKYDNFRKAFDGLNIGERKIESTLLLGLGLGSIPQMLETIYKVDSDYIAVEIDPEICKLADEYILSDLKSNFQVFPIDASNYFQWYDHKFDLINMDIFQSATVPPEFETTDFFEILQSRLNPGGIILFNRLAESKSNSDMNHLFGLNWESVFPKGGYIQSKNNQIFINDLALLDEKYRNSINLQSNQT